MLTLGLVFFLFQRSPCSCFLTVILEDVLIRQYPFWRLQRTGSRSDRRVPDSWVFYGTLFLFLEEPMVTGGTGKSNEFNEKRFHWKSFSGSSITLSLSSWSFFSYSKCSLVVIVMGGTKSSQTKCFCCCF